MPFRDILKKKDKVAESDAPVPEAPHDVQGDEAPVSPTFTFMRSDTHTQEIISPPTFSSAESSGPPSFTDGHNESRTSRSFFKSRARSSSVASATSSTSRASEKSKSKSSPKTKRLSQRLHLRKSDISSSNVPIDLPEIAVADEGDGGVGIESQWEKRATILAKKNEQERSRPSTPLASTTDLNAFADMTMGIPGKEKGPISTRHADDDIQEAIRLHEAGDLVNSTRMFGRLADPNGENNALSQVLYGLALRYGNWPLFMRPESLLSKRFWSLLPPNVLRRF